MSLYGGIVLPGQPDLCNIQKLDLLPCRSLSEMSRIGFAVDIPYLNQLTSELESEMSSLRADICSFIPPEKLDEFINESNLNEDAYLPMNVESGEQLAKLLFRTLGIGSGRELKRTKSGNRISTGKKELEKLKNEHEIIRLVLAYRERSKLVNTYTKKLPILARLHPAGCCWCGFKHYGETWRVHSKILTTRTSTGRLASRDINQQNISTRTPLGRKVRKAFIASPGMKLVSCDFSQIEVRLTADYTADPNLIRIFNEHLDPHEDTARRAFGLRPDEKPDKLTQRDPSKTTTFLVLYSGSEVALYDTLTVNFALANLPAPDWLTPDWCKEFIHNFLYNLYPTIPEYWAKQDYRARRYGCVWTRFGRVRMIPEVRSVHRRVMEAGLRQARNSPIQGTAADINKLAIAKAQESVVEGMFRENGIDCYPVMTVHDEWIGEVEESHAEALKSMVEAVMGEVMNDVESGENQCRVEISAEGKVMERWKKD